MNPPMHIIYIDFGEKNDRNSTSGIERKKVAQINELSKLGDVRRITFSPQGKNGLLQKIVRRLPFTSSMFPYSVKKSEIENVQVVYFRRACVDRYVIKLFKEIKNTNPRCIILFEIPTFPYDKELTGISNYPLLIKEKWNRRKLHKYVDRIVVVACRETSIFSIPAIKIVNGIDFSKIFLRKINLQKGDYIHAIIVGHFRFYHGLDRMIEGMKQYYSNEFVSRIFILHVVGPINNTIQIDNRTDELISKGYVIFHDKLPHNALEEIYDKVSLACEAFGMHRRSLGQISSSIKSREYGAKGLPIISECMIDYLENGYPYFLKISEDETPVNIEDLINFHDRVYLEDESIVAQKIRKYAEIRCSSEMMMKPVLDFCKATIPD